MNGLNENHKRRILASLQHADSLLDECMRTLTPASRRLFARYVPDVAPAEARWVESYADKIREQMARLMERFEAKPHGSDTAASWVLRTSLITLDIALEDLYPDQMRGYGEMDPVAARDLTWTINEIRRLVTQLLAFLSEERNARSARLACVRTDSLPKGLLERLIQIISRYGLVEFLPALNSILRKIESHRFEIAVFGRVSSGKSSLINRLLKIDLLPVGTTPITAVPIHIVAGPGPLLRVSFPGKVEEMRADRLAEFATEQQNPSNTKRVTALEATVPSERLQAGVAFVDTPGIASLATTGTELAYAYLPDSDLGLVLVDGHGSLGKEDLDLLRSLHVAGIPSVVMVSKCDLLSSPDTDRVVSYIHKAISEHLGFSPDIVAVSSVDSWAPRLDAWFEKAILPLLVESRESLAGSLNRKVESLRDSLRVTLEIKASRSVAESAYNPQDVERLLRPLDESLNNLKKTWERELETLSEWREEILDGAAVALAQVSSGENEHPPAHPVVEAALRVVVSHCDSFLRDYEALANRIIRQLAELDGTKLQAQGSRSFDLPKPSALPSPVLTPLEGISISEPGPMARITRSSRIRHFRKELEEKVGPQIQGILEELRPRLQRWTKATVNDLEESFRLWTDPLRYRSTEILDGKSSAKDLQSDLEFLLEQTPGDQSSVGGNAITAMEPV